MDFQSVSELIRQRRSIYPPAYEAGKPIERTTLEQLLENANWAPTHKRTQPWRFIVFHSEESRRELGQYLANYYKDNPGNEPVSEVKYNKMLENPLRAGAIMAIVMEPDPAAKLPEFEEIAAVAMAVQNLWLSCTSLGLGAYWSSPSAILKATNFLGLQEGQRCLGLFYMGWPAAPAPAGQRTDMATKVQWR